MLWGDKGVVGVHLHLQATCPAGDLSSHLAQADNTQHFVAHLYAHECAPLPLTAAKRLVGLGYVAGQRHHKRDCVLCGGDGIASWSVDHRYPLLGRRLQVYVVDAHTGAADDLQLMAGLYDLRRGLGLAPDHQSVILSDDGEQVLWVQAQLNIHIAHGSQHLDSLGVYWVGYQYPGHHAPRTGAPAGWNPTLGSTVSRASMTWDISSSDT